MSNQERLNAPFGARCFLTEDLEFGDELPEPSLNAPFGARCFLSRRRLGIRLTRFAGLNAPYGARCFLTYAFLKTNDELFYVLMHLMALGAF